MNISPIKLESCPKNFTTDLDKAVPPAETIARVKKALGGTDILAGCKRVDAGRLGIPVYLGICGPKARAIMPTRKQMGKGASPAQAEASAIMELMERYAFFGFWQDPPHIQELTWSEARERFGEALLPIGEMLKSVQDSLDEEIAEKLLDLCTWQFYPTTDLKTGRIVWLPLDWFRLLGEFNGSSAGNTAEESLLQGIAELIERHVCCLADNARPELPTIDLQSCKNPVLDGLLQKFAACGIRLILKDLSLDMPMPTVGAVAWDPQTFPESSEIVFTAGTATSPSKAAIRALTEVAQLGGDFCTNACYEASGLPKFSAIRECAWLEQGPLVALDSLPDVSDNDILIELQKTLQKLPVNIYAVETTRPELGIPAHYSMGPGLQFRERDKNQSLGLFIGRKLVEDAPLEEAIKGLAVLEDAYPGAHFVPFFAGMLKLRQEQPQAAAVAFEKAMPLQPEAQARALAAFYAGHAWAQAGEWQKAVPDLETAIANEPDLKEAHNLLGVAFFKTGEWQKAEACFDRALTIDKGSAMDLANRGMARKKQGKYREAMQDLAASLELDPGLDFARDALEEIKKTVSGAGETAEKPGG